MDARPGAGVRIGVLDSGVDLGHILFTGARITETLLQGLPDEVLAGFPTLNSLSHGTAVTGIMAAQPGRGGFTGLAWGADFKVFTAPITDYFSASEISSFDYAAAYRAILQSGVDIVNNSLAIQSTFVENYDVGGPLRGSALFDEVLDDVAPVAQTGVENPAIFVWSAGNDHGAECDGPQDQNCFADSGSTTGYSHRATSPNVDAGIVALLPELQGHNVVAVATDRSGEIASFSNRCGIAGPWCIAAPGVDVISAYFGPQTDFDLIIFRGTSAATPMVSGGLALMKHFFRNQLTNRELLTRLFATADKSDVYAPDSTADDGTPYSSIYGQGMMDLGAAVSPVGTARISTSARADAPGGEDVRTTSLQTGAAFGDVFRRALAGREIAAFDSLGAPFWFKASDFAWSAGRSSGLRQLSDLMAPKEADWTAARGTRTSLGAHARAVHRGGWRFASSGSPGSAESSLLNVAENALTLAFRARNGLEATMFAAPDHDRGSQASEIGALLAWRPAETPFGVRLGWLREEETVLGSRADGAFGSLSADNLFAGFEAAAEFGGWRLALDAEIGLVAPGVGGGIIDDFSRLTTSAVSLRASRRLGDRDEVVLSVSQPPRVESGSARLTLPVGRGRDGAVLSDSFSASLVPSVRQIDVSTRWRRKGVFGGELRAGVIVSHNPGHADAKPALNLMTGWRTEF